MKFYESYLYTSISTGCLSRSDVSALDNKMENMALKRDTGWFMKFYEDDEGAFQRQIEPFSAHIQTLLKEAYRQGYRMIEFDADAPEPNWEHKKNIMKNADRADSVVQALRTFALDSGTSSENIEVTVTDLLTNLMHFYDHNRHMEKSVEYCMAMATQHYYEEVDHGQ